MQIDKITQDLLNYLLGRMKVDRVFTLDNQFFSSVHHLRQ